ncbi:MAG: GHKL domain-containing protein [Lachnospiraceae bacterium]|nr:GHKL domain-containing protein [Lachnospiraceae bacterium]
MIKILRVFEAEVLLVVFIISEGFGVFLIDTILNSYNLMPSSIIVQKSIETMFSKLVLIFFYYIVVSRIWKKSLLGTKKHYGLYLIMFVYSMINFLIVAVIALDTKPIILTIIMGCTIFANMYFLHFIKYSDERNYYKLQVEMMQQQEKLQYENYEMQFEKYNQAVSILHDVDKHMKMIEELYQTDIREEAINYSKQIKEMLKPLLPYKYINNPILDCLLSDKKRMAVKYNIDFKIDISDVDVNFIKPIDITTLFGNLIDNAMAECKENDVSRYIGITIKEHNDMISIRVENSIVNVVPIKNGMIDTTKGENPCIGLLNIQKCVNTYMGSIIYKCSDKLLMCDIVLNRIDD